MRCLDWFYADVTRVKFTVAKNRVTVKIPHGHTFNETVLFEFMRVINKVIPSEMPTMRGRVTCHNVLSLCTANREISETLVIPEGLF